VRGHIEGGLLGALGRRSVRHLLIAGFACALAAPLLGAGRPGTPGPLQSAGLLGNERTLVPIPPDQVAGSSYVPGSNVLRLADGRRRYLPPGADELVTVAPDDPLAHAAVAADRAWLAAGTVPGETAAEREAAGRSLLYLRLLLRPGGAAIAAQTPYWAYVWPRDSSFAAAAFASTGHRREALEIVAFLARTQRPDGSWPARSHPDGTPVADDRPAQLDADGWVPWAAWLAADQGRDAAAARQVWPVVRAAADRASRSLRRDGLPAPSPDYWERRERLPTLGTAAPLLAGLRAAGHLAAAVGAAAEAGRYRSAAARLAAAIPGAFAGPEGYHRYGVRPGVHSLGRAGGPDAAVTWLAPPFAPADPAVARAVRRAGEQLGPGGGGAVPGLRWRDLELWTPTTASFALAAMASGDRASADLRLAWLLDHRTALGAFPERVRRNDGEPRSAAPLAWTHALVLLTLASERSPLPIP
jgi:glucoamylase